MSVNGTVRSHPSESSGVAGALAMLTAHLLGVDDPDVIVALAVVFGFVPAAITWTVLLFRRRNGQAPKP